MFLLAGGCFGWSFWYVESSCEWIMDGGFGLEGSGDFKSFRERRGRERGKEGELGRV